MRPKISRSVAEARRAAQQRAATDSTDSDQADSSEVDRSADRTDNTERSRQERADRHDRADRPERTDRSQRPEGSAGNRQGDTAGSPDDTRSGGSRRPRAMSSSHLQIRGPAVTHFHGYVEKVFGTRQRPRPSTKPLGIAVVALMVAVSLPYAVAWLPVIVLLLLAWLWLRHKNWIRGGLRLPRFGQPTSDAGLQIVSFHVRVPCDDDPSSTFKMITCRLVQKVEAGPTSLVSSDEVTGRGWKARGGAVEVSQLRVGDSPMTLQTTSPRSSAPILVLSTLIVAGAAGLLYLRWDTIPAVSWESVLLPVGSVLAPLLAMYVLVKHVFRRR